MWWIPLVNFFSSGICFALAYAQHFKGFTGDAEVSIFVGVICFGLGILSCSINIARR